MLLPSRTLSISIDCPSERVYAFVSNPANLPTWATGFCKSIRQADAGWTVETSQGPMKLRFVEPNKFGVVDHYVTPAPGPEVYVPLRVLPNGSGSDVMFTLFRLPDMSADQYVADAALVERDLQTLKRELER